MSGRARIDSMKPERAGATRTAPPQMPDRFPLQGNYRGYVSFGASGVFLVAVGLLLLRGVFALGDESSWAAFLSTLGHPVVVVFNALAFLVMTWHALRFFRLFPKTQPPRIGPFPRPPDAFFKVALNGGFAALSLAVVLVLWGAIP